MTSIFGSDYQQRKNIPLFSFLVRYFPDALVEVTKVCVAGNAQHNPELALTDINWSRGKSTDQLNTAMRHMVDHVLAGPIDEEPPEVLAAIDGEECNGGTYHLAKAAWRILAELQTTIEKRRADKPRRQDEAFCRVDQWTPEQMRQTKANGPTVAPDPVHKGSLDGKWYFWDETWGERQGPFETEEIARREMKWYIWRLLEAPEIASSQDEDIQRLLLDPTPFPRCSCGKQYVTAAIGWHTRTVLHTPHGCRPTLETRRAGWVRL